MTSVLIADDHETCLLVQHCVSAPDREIEIGTTPEAAIARAQARPFDVVITGFAHGDASDLDLLRVARAVNPAVCVIVLSALGSLVGTIQALRSGAFDYLAKPFDPVALRTAVDRALAPEGLRLAAAESASILPPLIGRAPAMLQLFKQIAQAAPADAPALVLGESGTGKALVARALHDHGPRQARPFVTVLCSGISDVALEAALFARDAGEAGIGTTTGDAGGFARAAGGTIFLDEIGGLSPAMQARVLRALQESETGTAQGAAPPRVVASTNVDIEAAVAAGRFRRDLFFRLAVFTIRVPPLRDRRQDVPVLVDAFAAEANARMGHAVSFTAAAVARLRQLDWPGNVRELGNMVERLVASARGRSVDAPDLVTDPPPSAPLGAHPFADLPTLDELERRYLRYALLRCGGNRTRTAARLGIDRRTLYRMSERLGVPITGEVVPAPTTPT